MLQRLLEMTMQHLNCQLVESHQPNTQTHSHVSTDERNIIKVSHVPLCVTEEMEIYCWIFGQAGRQP